MVGGTLVGSFPHPNLSYTPSHEAFSEGPLPQNSDMDVLSELSNLKLGGTPGVS